MSCKAQEHLVLPLTDEQTTRFFAKIDRRGPNECWPWLAGKFKKDGYGKVKINYITFRAHRIAYAIAHGPPGDTLVCHSCDFRPCCNSAHLFKGNEKENSADMFKKGRQHPQQGEDSNRAVFTTAQVLDLRARLDAGEPAAPMARALHVHPSTLSNIKTRKNWSHV